MLNSCPYSIQRSDISGPVADQHQRRRRDKILVLVMKIYHPYYLMFLTCLLVFYQIALHTYKKLLVVVIISQSENSEL